MKRSEKHSSPFLTLNILRVGRLTGSTVYCLFVLSCCFVEYFNINRSELVASCIKCTRRIRRRIPSGEGVGVATIGVRISFAPCVVWYVDVVSVTKRWSVIRAAVYSVTGSP